MAKRKRVGLIYTYNENWIGGTYYIENLIKALGQLPDQQQPELVIFSLEAADAERLQQNVVYPYWSFRRFERTLSLLERVANKVTASLIGKRFISLLYADVDLVFPLSFGWLHTFSRIPHHVYWIPDFQEHYLPEYFKPEEITERKIEQQSVVQIARNIVFSSYATQADFNSIYTDNRLTQYILQFAVTSPPVEQSANYLKKYSIDRPYFICSNQFWKHKNHPVVLRAFAQVLAHSDSLLIFTGKEHDYRNPDYFEEIKNMQQQLGLSTNVKFLGFIPREDQLALMKGALAVIQPSLFEGWSTVVEDAKSMNIPLIASNLAVHREQLENYKAKLFFEPKDAEALASCMRKALSEELFPCNYSYEQDVLRFAQSFMTAVDQVIAS